MNEQLQHSGDAGEKLKQRVLLPLTVMFCLSLAAFSASLYHNERDHLTESFGRELVTMQASYHEMLTLHGDNLRTALGFLEHNPDLRAALTSGDRTQLQTRFAPLFEQLKRDFNITHFYFLDANRVTLLRLHQTARFGDRIERVTAREAERTGRLAMGVELGPLGTLTLRAVMPLREGGRTIGYVELGAETLDIVQDISREFRNDAYVLLHKKYLSRQEWEQGMRMLGRKAEWDRYPELILVAQTRSDVPPELNRIFAEGERAHKLSEIELQQNGQIFRLGFIPLLDVSGRYVGDLAVLRNITATMANTRQMLLMFAGVTIVCGVLLFIMIYLILGRMQRTLVESRARIIKDAEERAALQNRHIEELMSVQEMLLKLSRAVENSPASVVITDLDGAIEYVNPKFCKVTGYSLEEAIGQNPRILNSGIQAEAFYENLWATILSGSEWQGEIYNKKKNGEIFLEQTTISPIRDEQGAIIHFVAVKDDITERRKAEDALLSQKQFLDSVIDSVPGIFYMLDQQGGFIRVNPQFLKISGYSDDELRSMTALSFFDLKDQELITLKMQEVFEIGHSCAEAEFITKSGQNIPYYFSGRRTTIDGQHYIVGLGIDITERKRTEKELLELNETLEERVNERTRELAHAKELAEASSQAKSAFLSNMSHEIRTPLNSVMGMAHLALRTNPTPRQCDYLEKIHHSGEHLLGIIDDILDFSKIEAGKLSIETVDFKLGDVMENLANMVGLKAAEKRLRFVVDINPALSSPLRGDPLRLGQVLINLANNAVKFTEKGEISVRAKKLEASKLEENDTDIRVRFEVRDSGIGISAEDRLKLFQSFQQADASTTRKYGGTGLGLAICKQLVELMDGEIGVDSEVGRGSTFWFTVRLGKSSAVPAPQNPEMAVAGQSEVLAAIKGAYILLVEDNPFNQQVATELLEEAGMIVCVANNGEEALDLLRQEQFDCVLMDVQMPVMDGFEATRQIRAQPALTDMRVIAMTANAESEDRARCLAAGMDDFLTKPILPELLYATLARWLAGRRVQAQQRTGERRALADRREQHTASVAATNPPAATPQTNDSAIIDLTVLAKMVGNDPAKICKFALKFLTSAQEGLDEIQSALEHKNMPAVAALGHRIKSPARTVGALGFAELCQTLEQCKHDEDAEQAQGILSRLRALLEQIKAQIETSFSGQ